MHHATQTQLADRSVTLEQLRAFVLIAQAGGGFCRAGVALHRSQSAVTQRLRRLEASLGCRLIERQRGSVGGLTADGRRLMPAAIDILRRTAEVIGAMQQPQPAGCVRIGVPEDFRIAELRGAISQVAEVNRQLKVEVTSALSVPLTAMFKAGDLDMAIINCIDVDEFSKQAGESRVLRRERLHWVGWERRRLDEFADLPLVGFSDHCAYTRIATDALAQVGRSYYRAYVSASYDNLRLAINQGLGISVLPASAIDASLVTMGEAEGFPVLPEVCRVMIESSSQPLARRLGEIISTSHAAGAGFAPRSASRPGP